MAVTTLTSREFSQDTSRAKEAARRGPVFITNRGRPVGGWNFRLQGRTSC